MQPEKIDGRTLRAQKTYQEVHERLVSAAIDLYNNPLMKNNKITVSLIAKNAGVSVATAYNHFPDNKLDILGSIFKLGFGEVTIDFVTFTEKNHDPLDQLNEFLTLISDKIIELGDAVRYAFFNINEILEIGLLEVNTKLTRVWNQELNQDNKKLNFIGALDINLTAKLGLDLTKVKIEDEGNEIVISNTKPHFLSFSELQYNWRISELLEFKEPFIGSSYWRKTNDLFEQCTKIKDEYQTEVHQQIKNGPEELDWIINPLHEKIEKILTKKYGQPNKHIVFIDNKIIDRKSVENK